MSDKNEVQRDPTEKTLYQEPHDDHYGTWQDRLYECGKAPRKGIGIAVGGLVYVMPLKDWHALVQINERYKTALKKYGWHKEACACFSRSNRPLNNETSALFMRRTCNCGFEAALADIVEGK